MIIAADFDADEFLDILVQETTELIETLERALVNLGQQVGEASVIAQLFRVAHSLRASAAGQELEDTAHPSHAMGDVPDGIRQRQLDITPERIGLLLEGVDALKVYLGSALPGQPSPLR